MQKVHVDRRRQTAASRKQRERECCAIFESVVTCCAKNIENSACCAMLWHVIIDVMHGKSREKHFLRSAPEGPFPAKFEVSGAN
jgi:hypothetical protein